MRLSFAEARRLNICEDIIRRAQESGRSIELSAWIESQRDEPPKPKRTKSADGFASKLERDFAAALDRGDRGLVTAWWYEPLTFRLGGRTRYTPDFGVAAYAGRFCCVEVKGPYAREDSLVKLKVAADMYACFRWLLVARDGQHNWVARDVTRNGISREPIAIPWIG